VAWFTGLVNKQNGYLDEAIASFRSILEADNEETRRRGFDFSKDYTLIAELGQTLFERAKQERGEARRARRDELIQQAREQFERVLELDPENTMAHFNLNLIYRQLADRQRADQHFALYEKYKVDDNARDRAVTVARSKDPAANHAAEAIVIYDLNRPEAYETAPGPRAAAAHELIVPPPAAEPTPAKGATR
jgi:tetratricopeptide (TPR) repeat protein